MCKEPGLFISDLLEADLGRNVEVRGTQGQGSDSLERRSIEECVSVQVCGPAGLSEITDCGVTHYFILSMALIFQFYFLALWKHKLVSNVFINGCNEEDISLYTEN